MRERPAGDGGDKVISASKDMVTLVVSQWSGVAPGILALACPDLPTAQRVAQALRNALRWFVVPGAVGPDEALRAAARGDVLLRDERDSCVDGLPTDSMPPAETVLHAAP